MLTTANVATKVYKTTAHEMFRTLDGNRNLNKLHLERLKKSMDEEYLLSPILVNERYEVIDGQHRLQAAKDLALPVNYIVVEGYGLSQVQRLNSNGKNWGRMDYIEAHCDLGNENYIALHRFYKEFKEFSITSVTNVLAAKGSPGASWSGQGYNEFNSGLFVAGNYNEAADKLMKVRMLKPYYDGYNRAVFVKTMLSLFENEAYSHSQFISKITQQPSALVHCANVRQYRLLIESIYNYRSRNKVSLLY